MIAQDKTPPRTHDLVLLLNVVMPNPAPELRQAVLKLAEIVASSRYPDDLEPVNAALAADYANAAQVVVTAVELHLGSV